VAAQNKYVKLKVGGNGYLSKQVAAVEVCNLSTVLDVKFEFCNTFEKVLKYILAPVEVSNIVGV
jgi:hypothetical protein